MTGNDSTVYVIDDEPAIRDSLASLVSQRELQVETFASAEEFLAACPASPRGCAITDVRMPGMSGLDLLEALKARGAELPVIVITAYADVAMAVQAMHRGAVTFLEKPWHDDELWKAINLALGTSEDRVARREERERFQANRASLTPDEAKVMERMVAGQPNKSIAVELDMGLRTVELRRANVLKKMQAESLAELVRIVILGARAS